MAKLPTGFQAFTKQNTFMRHALASCLLLGFLSVLAGAYLTGCAGSPKGDSNPQPITLRFACWGSANELATLKGLVTQFETKHPGVKVQLLHSPQNYFQKLHILIASSLTPDVMQVNSLSLPVYSQHNVFKDLTPYWDTPELAHLKPDDFYTSALNSLSDYETETAPQKRVLALPRDVSDVVVYVNKTMLAKHHVPVPSHKIGGWDRDTLLTAAKAVTVDANQDGHPEQFGISFFSKPPLFWLPFVWSNGGSLFTDHSTTELALDDPKTLDALQFYADLRNTHHVAPTRKDTGGTSMTQLFIQGKLAMMVNGRWVVPVLRKQAKFDWDVAPFPSRKLGTPSVVGIDSSGYAVAQDTAHPKESLALLAFLSSPDAQRQWTDSGLIIPALKSVAQDNAFLQPTLKPAHAEVFLSVIEHGQPTRTPPQWDEFSELLQLSLEPVWHGESTAQNAVKPVLPKLKQLLPK